MLDSFKNKIMVAGSSAIVAVAAYVIIPYEGQVVNSQGDHVGYLDMVGVPTACWGTTGKDLHGDKIRAGKIYTQDECEKLLVRDLALYNNYVKRYVKVPLKPYEEVAYTSFIWNVGETAFKNSTLLKKLNKGDPEGACKEILNWNKATFAAKAANVQIRNGETCTAKGDGMFSCTVKGLTNRRLDEYKTCTGNNPRVNEALHELAISQNAPETSELVDTSIHLPEINESVVEPSDVVPEPLEEQRIVPVQKEAVSEVKCSFKLFGLCFQKR